MKLCTLALALILVLAACGGSDNSSTTATADTSATSQETAPATDAEAADAEATDDEMTETDMTEAEPAEVAATNDATASEGADGEDGTQETGAEGGDQDTSGEEGAEDAAPTPPTAGDFTVVPVDGVGVEMTEGGVQDFANAAQIGEDLAAEYAFYGGNPEVPLFALSTGRFIELSNLYAESRNINRYHYLVQVDPETTTDDLLAPIVESMNEVYPDASVDTFAGNEDGQTYSAVVYDDDATGHKIEVAAYRDESASTEGQISFEFSTPVDAPRVVPPALAEAFTPIIEQLGFADTQPSVVNITRGVGTSGFSSQDATVEFAVDGDPTAEWQRVRDAFPDWQEEENIINEEFPELVNGDLTIEVAPPLLSDDPPTVELRMHESLD